MEYTLISGTFTIKSENTYGIGLISTNREGTKRYFHFDGLGSTGALTDVDEDVTDTYTYTAFGDSIVVSVDPSVNPYQFVGQWGYYDDGARDSSGDLVLLYARYLNPQSGRFLSWDPVLSTNPYRYVFNRPIVLSDPSGAWPWDPCGFEIWLLPRCTLLDIFQCTIACMMEGRLPLGCLKLPFTCTVQCLCSRLQIFPFPIPRNDHELQGVAQNVELQRTQEAVQAF